MYARYMGKKWNWKMLLLSYSVLSVCGKKTNVLYMGNNTKEYDATTIYILYIGNCHPFASLPMCFLQFSIVLRTYYVELNSTLTTWYGFIYILHFLNVHTLDTLGKIKGNLWFSCYIHIVFLCAMFKRNYRLYCCFYLDCIRNIHFFLFFLNFILCAFIIYVYVLFEQTNFLFLYNFVIYLNNNWKFCTVKTNIEVKMN